ncbi:chaperonin GroEL [Candidatus Vidania fulgoroideorum]
MNKKIFFKNSILKILKGIEKLYKCVKITLGPKGSNVIIEKKFGSPYFTKDGVTVAKEIVLKNKLENIGAQIIKEVALKTNDDAGDGTTTATILSRKIIKESYKYISLGSNPLIIKKELKKILKIILKKINLMSKKIKKNYEIFQVASISSNNDKKIGKIISKALSIIGKNGTILLEDGKFDKNKLEIVKGYSFDGGYISSYFLKNNEKSIILEDPYILIYYKKLLNFRKIIKILEYISKKEKPLLIITYEIENDVLTNLILNNLKGIFKSVVVKFSDYNSNKDILDDISLITGANIIKENKKIKINDLGKAKKIEIKKKLTTIIKGKGNKKKIDKKIKNLKKMLIKSNSDYEYDILKERISKISGGIAIIKVGGSTESEIKEKKYRMEDAVNATKAAIEEGIIPGGGLALVRIAEWLKKNIKKKKRNIGYNIMIKSMYSPFFQILKNANETPEIVLEKISNKKNNFGYNIIKKKYCNIIKSGIVDPAKVLKFALINSISISLLIINTNCIIVSNKNNLNIN